MTRDEALHIQYLQSCKKHDGTVIWQGKPYYLGPLNYPTGAPVAKICDANGKAPHGSSIGGWVPLDELDAAPF